MKQVYKQIKAQLQNHPYGSFIEQLHPELNWDEKKTLLERFLADPDVIVGGHWGDFLVLTKFVAEQDRTMDPRMKELYRKKTNENILWRQVALEIVALAESTPDWIHVWDIPSLLPVTISTLGQSGNNVVSKLLKTGILVLHPGYRKSRGEYIFRHVNWIPPAQTKTEALWDWTERETYHNILHFVEISEGLTEEDILKLFSVTDNRYSLCRIRKVPEMRYNSKRDKNPLLLKAISNLVKKGRLNPPDFATGEYTIKR